MAIYDLWVSQRPESANEEVDWKTLASEFGLSVLRERRTQITVEAEPEVVARLRDTHPEIHVTTPKTYHRLGHYAA